MKLKLRIPFLFLVSLVVLFAFQAFAADPKTVAPTASKPVAQPVGTMQPVEIKRVECVVAGATEFPVSIQMHNTGNAAIPKGWIVAWTVPNTVKTGKYTLLADLPVNGYVMASNQIPGGHPGGAILTCTVAAPAMLSVKPVKRQTAAALNPAALAQFGCVVQGSPTEFPDDVLITNKLTTTVAKGKTIHWSIPNTTRQGDYVLTEDLLGGKSVFVSGAVPGGMSAGVKCDAKLK
ncbi:MAG: hypothetical protein WC538_07175 [Thermoanaerobaculia bacterium]